MLKSGDIGYGMPKSQTSGKGKTGMSGPTTIPTKQGKKPVAANKKVKTPTVKVKKEQAMSVGKTAKI